MNYNHLLNAHDKLVATEPHRTDEISAMRAHLDTLEAEQADEVAK